MGVPSIGIYSLELFTEYDVDTMIIKLGLVVVILQILMFFDLINVDGASESTYAKLFGKWMKKSCITKGKAF